MRTICFLKLSPISTLILFSFTSLVLSIDSGVISQTIEIIELNLNLSSKQAGVIGSCQILGSIIASPLVAYFSQYIHPYNIILAGLSLWSLALLGIGFLGFYWSILLFRGLIGVGGGVVGIIILPVIMDISPVARTALWLSLIFFSGIVGNALGFLYANSAYNFLEDWHGIFVIQAMMPLPSILVLLVAQRTSIANPQYEGESTSFKDQFCLLIKTPVIVILSFSAAAIVFTQSGYGFWLVPILHEHFGISMTISSVILAVMTVLTGIGGSLAGSALYDSIIKKSAREFERESISQREFDFIRCRIGNKILFYEFCVAFAFGCLAVCMDNVYMFLTGLSVNLFILCAAFGAFVVCVNTAVDPTFKKQANAFISIVADLLGNLPGPFAIGAIIDWLGYRWASIVGLSWTFFVALFAGFAYYFSVTYI